MQDVESQSLDHIILIHWKKLIFGAFFGLLLGSIAYVLLPSKWESVAFVQIGAISGNQIEPLSVVIERLKLRSFKDAAAQRAGKPELSELLKGESKIKLRKLRKTQVFEMRIQANTPELSKIAVESIFNQLVFQHSQLIQEHFRQTKKKEKAQNIQESIELILDQIKSKNVLIDNTEKELNSSAHDTMLYLNKVLGLMRVTELRKQRIETEPRPTRLIEPVNTSIRPVSPHLFSTLLIGMLIGLIFSAGFIYIRSRP